MINIRNIKFKNSIVIIIALIIILIVQIIIGMFIERKKTQYEAFLNNQSLIFSIKNEALVSYNPNYNADPKKSINDISLNEQETSSIVDVKNSENYIAIIVGGLGLSTSETQNVLSLPIDVTMGFSPYALDMAKFADTAYNNGYEVMINLPLEPVEYPDDDPGELALLSHLPVEENKKRINFIISQFLKCKGLYSVESQKFTRSIENDKMLLNTLKDQQKIFVFTNDTGSTVLQQIAQQTNYNLITNDSIIDQVASTDAINENLQNLEKLAKQNGYAVGYANPYPITVDILKNWIPSLKEKNIKLVPISKIYHQILGK
jgi:uncharacterized protein